MSAEVMRWKRTAVTGAVYQRRDCEYRRIQGHVATPHGIVIAYTWDDRPVGHRRGVELHMSHDGYSYNLYDHSRSLTARGLTTVAGRFARDVAAGRYEG